MEHEGETRVRRLGDEQLILRQQALNSIISLLYLTLRTVGVGESCDFPIQMHTCQLDVPLVTNINDTWGRLSVARTI